MRKTRLFVGGAVVVSALAGCGDRIPGTYVGGLDLSRSASLTSAPQGGEAEVRRFSGGQHTDGATVTVRESGDGYRVEIPGCAFDAVRDRAQNGFVAAPGQTCPVDLDGSRVEFSLVVVSGRLEPDGDLSLTIDGTAATPNAAGGVGWRFQGQRQ